MRIERMCARVSSARALGAAQLSAHRFVFNKRGRDGSAKANLVRDADARVWGVVYEIAAHHLEVLDGYEGGYERRRLEVRMPDRTVESHVYLSQRLIDDPRPFDWYREHVLVGAAQHGLPEPYRSFLEAFPWKPGVPDDASR